MASDSFVVAQAPDARHTQNDESTDTGDATSTTQPGAFEDAELEDDELETLSPTEQAAALQRRGRANVLGMDLEPGANGRAVVVDVTAASPAFDAGILEGDVIVSFDGFAAKTYREWIDGIRRMVRDAPDGATVAIEVLRDGKSVVANVQTPESRVDDPLLPNLFDPMQTAGSGGAAAPTNQSAIQPQGAAPGNSIFINNAPFNDAFGADLSPAIDRALAEIVRLGEQQSQPENGIQEGSAQVGAQPSLNARAARQADFGGTPPAGPEGRVGMAGFRDAQEGMLVMVDVGGLEPGSYRVSVEDPAIGLGSDSLESQNNTSQRQPQPATSTTAAPPTGRVNPQLTPPTGQVNPPVTPPTGRVLPSGTAATGLPVDDARVVGSSEAGAANNPSRSVSGPRNALYLPIGMLTIDESGTGRLQQEVKGIRVREVVGQVIVIYAPAEPPETTVPANPNVASEDANVAPSVSQAAANVRPTGTASRSAPQSADGITSTLGLAADGAARPVAVGMIRLLPDRRPTTDGTSAPGGQAGQARPPANDAPPSATTAPSASRPTAPSESPQTR
jgi:hypothetical protein